MSSGLYSCWVLLLTVSAGSVRDEVSSGANALSPWPRADMQSPKLSGSDSDVMALAVPLLPHLVVSFAREPPADVDSLSMQMHAEH